jgi:acyl-CoA thioesterase-1
MIRILALGDSLTEGYCLASDEAFPAVLQRALAARGRAVEVVNAGVSGDTTWDGLARLEPLLRRTYDAAIVELGINDAFMGIGFERIYANLDRILARLTQAGLPILLCGIRTPPELGADVDRRLAEVYARLCRAHDVVFHADFLERVIGVPGLTMDGVHPTARGVEAIVTRILDAALQLLDRIPPAAD